MLNRSTPPPFAKEFSFDLPTPTVWQIGQQNVIWVKSAQEVVKLDFVFKAGKWFEPKTGVAYFTAQMLEKGSVSYTAEKIAEILDYHGAQLEISVGSDFTSISFYSLSKNLLRILPVALDILQAPTFPAEELALAQDIFKQNLQVNNEKTSYLASKQFQKNVFGKEHPYGRSIDEADINKITAHDLSSFFSSNFTVHEIYLTGHLSNPELDLLNKSLSQLGKKQIDDVKITDATLAPQTEKKAKEGSVQASIRVGRKLFNRTHADYAETLLLTHLLGGFFGSRLMKNIREEKGLTYGIHASITAYLHAGLFSIGTDVNGEKAELTIEEIGKELNKLTETSVQQQEFDLAKNHLLGSLQLEISNPFAISEKIKTIRLNNLQPSYYATFFSVINNTSPERLRVLANKYLQPTDMHILQIG